MRSSQVMKASTLLEQLDQLQSQTDLTSLENHIFQLFLSATSASGGSLIGFDGNTWRVLTMQGNRYLLNHPRETPLQVHPEGPLRHSFETGEALFISVEAHSPSFHPSGYAGYQGGTALIFPLLHYPDHSFKFITLHSSRKRSFSISDFRFGNHLLHQVQKTLQLYFIKKSTSPLAEQEPPDFCHLYENLIENRTFIHNLRNIVSPLCLCLPFLNSQNQDSFSWKKAYANVEECLEHLKSLIRSLSPYQGEVRIAEFPIPLHLPSLLGSCAELALTGSPISIHCEPENLPSDAVWCWGFKNEIEQMILNLVKNAAEAMPGNGRIHLFFDTVRTEKFENENPLFEFEEYVCVHIKDSGCGMNEEMLRQIFNPGYTTKQNGSGLGLASVYRTLRKHLALVQVESEKNKGAEFKLFFPSLRVLSKERFLKTNPRIHIRL